MTNYQDLDQESKVWIYTAERDFTTQEIERINSKAEVFIADWESHGKAVKGLIEIRYNRFIFIYADDHGDSLCGRATDSSVRFVKGLEKEMGLSLMDRMLLSYKEGETVITTSLANFQQLINEGSIMQTTTVFNCMLSKKSDLDAWEIAAHKSWHKQLF